MKEMTLSTFAAEKGRTVAAKLLELSQPGLWKAINSGRDIRVRVHEDGRVDAYEIKPIGRRKAA